MEVYIDHVLKEIYLYSKLYWVFNKKIKKQKRGSKHWVNNLWLSDQNTSSSREKEFCSAIRITVVEM